MDDQVELKGEEELLTRLRQVAVDAGGDPLESYEPWLLMDSLQQCLLQLHQVTGEASLTVVLVALATRLVTWPWNRRALQRRCDAIHLMPIYQAIAKAYNDAQQRRGGKGGTGAAGAQEAEVDFQEASARLKDFTEETRFFPLQGLGYQFAFVLPVGFVYFGALYGIMLHPVVGLGRAAGPLRPAAVSVCPVFVGQCGAQHLGAQTWAGVQC